MHAYKKTFSFLSNPSVGSCLLSYACTDKQTSQDTI